MGCSVSGYCCCQHQILKVRYECQQELDWTFSYLEIMSGGQDQTVELEFGCVRSWEIRSYRLKKKVIMENYKRSSKRNGSPLADQYFRGWFPAIMQMSREEIWRPPAWQSDLISGPTAWRRSWTLNVPTEVRSSPPRRKHHHYLEG